MDGMSQRKSLTPAVIAAAALRLGDREGPAAMSMRRIAADLGCDPMALYRHFPHREGLLDAVADLALADAADPDPNAAWDLRLHDVLTAIRAAAVRHPGIAAHIAMRPPLHQHGRRLGAAMIAALAEAGLPPADVVRASQALVAYVAAALAMTVQAGQKDERWHAVSQIVSSMSGSLPGDEMPVVGSREQFEYGLRLLITGIQGEAARRTEGAEASP
jgi:AcrR family transcriptional regulator